VYFLRHGGYIICENKNVDKFPSAIEALQNQVYKQEKPTNPRGRELSCSRKLMKFCRYSIARTEANAFYLTVIIFSLISYIFFCMAKILLFLKTDNRIDNYELRFID